MIAPLETCLWPMARAGEALQALARARGLPHHPGTAVVTPARFDEEPVDVQTRWLEAVAARLGVEIEPVDARYADIDRVIRSSPPALLRVSIDGRTGLLVLLGARRRRASLVGLDRGAHSVPIAVVRAAVCDPLERPLATETERLLDLAQVPSSRRRRALHAIVRERLAATRIGDCWLVRVPLGARFGAQIAHARIGSRLAALTAAYAVEYALWILSWWIVGRMALEGRTERGWLIAWVLMLATLVPFQLLVTWLQGRVSIDAGALLKQRLLYGALRLDPEEIRREGAGTLLGRVIESQAVEALALSGGFLAMMAVVELIVAAAVLAAGGRSFLALLIVSCLLLALLTWVFWLRRRGWTASRLSMTHDLVERMVGHRTRLAQEAPERWHDGEDEALERYCDASVAMDRAAVWLTVLVPRGWLLAGVLALSPLFVSGASPGVLAVTLGGVILAHRAFRRLAAGMVSLTGATIAWTQAAPVFHAAARPQPIGSPAFALVRPGHEREKNGRRSTPINADTNGRDGRPLLEGHELSFSYRQQGVPVLRGCSIRVAYGDRLLLQGPSGAGKSTLVSLITGVRAPQSGVLLLDGADRQTLGADAWRRRVVGVPQFHENHVFMGTFAFNLLMGTEWPPRAADLARAETLCRELGLSDLLQRMPAGLLQQVGETGWQLSHGERSRLFIARALLQRADFLVIDESFAQLDPENLQRALACVLEHAPTVMVIAHA